MIAPAESQIVSPSSSAGMGQSVRRKQARSWTTVLLLTPALLFLGVMFVFPLFDVLIRSVEGTDGVTLEHYARVIDRPVYLKVFWLTIEIALLVTVMTLLLAYPLAYVLALSKSRWTGIAMIAVLMPFFTSILVRTYAWMVLLGPNGLVNQALSVVGLGPVALLYNRTGVLIGMTYALLPYMVLTLYSVMVGIDRRLIQAAQSLGASKWQAFHRIFLRLSLPGVMGGSLLVFILSLGYYITPRLLGGDRDRTIAMIIDQQIQLILNWGFGAALAVILLTITLIGFAVYAKFVGLESLFESKS